jgi:hypothetical protein
MAEADIEPAPTGAFGEGAAERPAQEVAETPARRDTSQHFSRWRRREPEDAAREGTAHHVPMIDRPKPAR